MCFCFVYTSVSYYLSSQFLSWTRFTMFLVVCQLMTLISEGLGLILGTVMSPVVSINIMLGPATHYQVQLIRSP
jgi:hypothetical protein